MSDTVKAWQQAEAELFFSVLDGLTKRGIKPGGLTVASVQCHAMAYPPPPKSEDGTPVATPDSDEELLYASANG